jgi:hypothetical protein
MRRLISASSQALWFMKGGLKVAENSQTLEFWSARAFNPLALRKSNFISLVRKKLISDSYSCEY